MIAGREREMREKGPPRRLREKLYLDTTACMKMEQEQIFYVHERARAQKRPGTEDCARRAEVEVQSGRGTATLERSATARDTWCKSDDRQCPSPNRLVNTRVDVLRKPKLHANGIRNTQPFDRSM